MYTGNMTYDELERFYYITNDPRHTVLVAMTENLTSSAIEQAEDEPNTALEQVKDAEWEAEKACEERDRMQDERDEANAELEALKLTVQFG